MAAHPAREESRNWCAHTNATQRQFTVSAPCPFSVLLLFCLNRIDDIEDNSKLRRGIPGKRSCDLLRNCHVTAIYNSTVAHNVFGVAQTINSANFIYFEALQRTLQLGHPEAVNIYTCESLSCELDKEMDYLLSSSAQLVELHLGQGKDIFWRDSHSCPSEPEYIQMVRESEQNSVSNTVLDRSFHSETGGLFLLGIALMQLFSDNKT